MADTMIEVKDLTKYYGENLAVDSISFHVEKGEVVGFLGPNGSGKTTTMGMLLGLTRPTAGSFRLFGERSNHQAALRRVGAIVETPTFYPYLTGRQNLAYFQGILGRGTAQELDDLLDQVSLADRADDRFHTYSLGMKQRLGLAYALLGDPELLFLDEPTNGMDPAGMAEMRGLIRSLGTEDRTVFLSSHLLNEVEQVCDSVVILSKGKLIAQGSVTELLKGRGQTRLRTTDNAQALTILTALDWVEEAKLEGEALVVTAPPERAPELSAALGRAEIYVTEMTSGAESLESYFLEITAEEGEAQ